MKRLPCTTRGCPSGGHATLRDGRPYLLGRAPVKLPYSYTCASCKRPTTVSAVEWNQLPPLSVEALRELGEMEPLTKDLRGAGFRPEEAVDLFRAGFTGPAALEPLERVKES